MRTSEFKEAVEELGFDLNEEYKGNIYIEWHKKTIAVVSKEGKNVVDTVSSCVGGIDEKIKENLFDNILKYASTPIAEREEEKRYRLKLNVPIVTNNKLTFLNKNIHDKQYMLSDEKEILGYKTIFTESELAEIDETGFERIEVEQ